MVVPNAKVHLYMGIITWGLLWNGGIYSNVIAVAVGSLIPDSDIRQAPAGKLLPLWIWFRHRGPIHTVWAMLIGAIPIGLIFGWYSGLGFCVGFFSHLFLDALTPSGIRWFGGKRKQKYNNRPLP